MSIDQKICFIGAGSMAEAIIAGMLKQGVVRPEAVSVANRSNQDRLSELGQAYGVRSDASHKELYVKEADILVLAMKPKDLGSTLDELRELTGSRQLIISVAAGVKTALISQLLGHDAPVIRTMPNTSAFIGQSVTGMCGGKTAQEDHFATAAAICESFGKVFRITEADMDALTAVAGSGPAFFYYFVESMLEGAKTVGLEQELSKELVLQTMLGAANMLLQSGKEPDVLRKEICSPGGTTLAGLDVLQSWGVEQAIRLCIEAAARRAGELGNALN